MKMKIEVNLEDIYPEVDNCNSENDCSFESVSEVIKDQVTYAIVKKIKEDIGEDLKRSISEAVKEKVLLHLDIKVKRKVRQLMKEGEIKLPGFPMSIKITDHIENLFKENSNWRTEAYKFLEEKTENMANKFIEDLTKKYDLIFAAKIVDKLGKAGFLKDETIKKLVSNED
jgi:hypothetical protein